MGDMKYVVPNWEKEYLSQPWRVQKWCLVRCEADLKKWRRKVWGSTFMLFWSTFWFVFEVVLWDGWLSIGFGALYALTFFVFWKVRKMESRHIEVIEAVYQRMRELSVIDT
jgi:hypothetical protein